MRYVLLSVVLLLSACSKPTLDEQITKCERANKENRDFVYCMQDAGYVSNDEYFKYWKRFILNTESLKAKIGLPRSSFEQFKSDLDAQLIKGMHEVESDTSKPQYWIPKQ
jgi:hypothetical protein